MLRRLVAVALLVAAVWSMIAQEPRAGGRSAKQSVSGLFLTTRYPALTVRAGETTTIDLALHNYKLPPQQLALSVPEIAAGWKATRWILGGGQPIGAAEVAPDADERLQLRAIEPPAGTGAGRLSLHRRGQGHRARRQDPGGRSQIADHRDRRRGGARRKLKS